MGRRKVEMKRIEDKSSRQVTFSKRRGGLMKKARELSVLCGVDVGVVVFSCSGKLYDFCSGTDRSVFLPAQTCVANLLAFSLFTGMAHIIFVVHHALRKA
ncbi:hypothetical protein RJ640_000016 [Escallonia rubra]|uniref:MADS-box domain-containing protein n=1 Tax=Escallonia rubra TaxID=112253 RepID=A0AA88UT48_9ASTE|nr:hypothetical protein RJ640_000016 [Escallonia rubra]